MRGAPPALSGVDERLFERLDDQEVLQELTSRILAEKNGTRRRILKFQRFMLRLVSGR